jgi:hypothetical protein
MPTLPARSNSAAPPKLHLTITPQHIAAAWNCREMQEHPSPLTLALAEQTIYFVGRWESPRVVELWDACLGGVLARYEAPHQLVAFMAAWGRGEQPKPARFTLRLLSAGTCANGEEWLSRAA